MNALTPAELDRIVRSRPDQFEVAFICPQCQRAHEPKDLGSSLQCRSCEHGLPTSDRPRCPDCTGVRVSPRA